MTMRKTIEWAMENSTRVGLALLAGAAAILFGEYAGALFASAARILGR
jgi:hypothetical protein